jgi:hypothetical protein
MQTTMNLLHIAEQRFPDMNLSDWAAKLGLSKRALYTAKDRGHLSPAVAGAFAEELEEDSREWIVVAALESERDSACKTRMLKRITGGARKLYLSTISTTRRVVRKWVSNTKDGAPRNARRNVKLSRNAAIRVPPAKVLTNQP